MICGLLTFLHATESVADTGPILCFFSDLVDLIKTDHGGLMRIGIMIILTHLKEHPNAPLSVSLVVAIDHWCIDTEAAQRLTQSQDMAIRAVVSS